LKAKGKRRKAKGGPHEFAIVIRDEIWSSTTLLERRLSHGFAFTHEREIDATDRCDDTLLAAVDAEITRARETLEHMTEARVRVVASARRVGEWMGVASSLSVAYQSLSLVSSTEFARFDYALLRSMPTGNADVSYRGIPILWRSGSGSVLLHEAAGHAAEHDHYQRWPAWLSVRDEPADAVDDTGAATTAVDLLTESPRTLRRQTFTDVPLPRMSNVIVRQRNAPFDLPSRRIEIHLLAGGRYDPLDKSVTLHVTASRLVDGSTTQPLAPFVITEPVKTIARSLSGATGEPERYPGVVCSREGQELVVASHAPLLLTSFP
jgi:hypothetical protein